MSPRAAPGCGLAGAMSAMAAWVALAAVSTGCAQGPLHPDSPWRVAHMLREVGVDEPVPQVSAQHDCRHAATGPGQGGVQGTHWALLRYRSPPGEVWVVVPSPVALALQAGDEVDVDVRDCQAPLHVRPHGHAGAPVQEPAHAHEADTKGS